MRLATACFMVAAVGCAACDPVDPVDLDREVVVATPRVAVNDLRKESRVVFVVTPEEPLSVVEVRAWVPPSTELVSNMLITSDAAPRALRRVVKEENGLSRWDSGELRPGQSQMFGVVLRDLGAEPGDTLTLPVQLMMSDGSVVDWMDPEHPDRPALRIPVVQPGLEVPPPLALAAASLAVAVLLLAGAWALLKRGGRARPTPPSEPR